MLKVNWYKKGAKKKKNRRITQQWGSMAAVDMLKMLEEADSKDAATEKALV